MKPISRVVFWLEFVVTCLMGLHGAAVERHGHAHAHSNFGGCMREGRIDASGCKTGDLWAEHEEAKNSRKTQLQPHVI
jgi:hypothetical protein